MAVDGATVDGSLLGDGGKANELAHWDGFPNLLELAQHFWKLNFKRIIKGILAGTITGAWWVE